VSLPALDAPPLQTALPALPDRPGRAVARLAISLAFVLCAGGVFLLTETVAAWILPDGFLSAGILPAAIVAILSLAATSGLFLVLRRTNRSPALRDGRDTATLLSRIEAADDRAWELRESEERYRAQSDAFGDLVVHTDLEGRILFANERFLSAFSLTPQRALGGPLPPELAAIRPGAMAGNGVRETRLDRGGATRWFRWASMPLRDGRSGIAATRWIARDATADKLVERELENSRARAEQANAAKSRFLATVSHEMRTPLNGILGMSALIAGTALKPEQAAYNEAIRSSGAALLTLIEDILDLTMIEAGRFEAKAEEFSPVRLTEEVVELLASRAHAKGIALAAITDPATPQTVRADAGRIRQVLVNLVGNAVKFTARGGVTVRLDAQAPGELAFTVADTGPGMNAADKVRVFDEFFQADSAPTRRHGGAGLGLSISQGIARQLGGSISVDSEPGRGAIFRFCVPAPAVAAAASAAAVLAGRSITVVSRFPVERAAVAEMLAAAGADVRPASRLAEAAILLGGAQGWRADALVFDIALSADPIRSLARLRRRAAANLFCVALVRPADRARLGPLLAAGFDAYVVTPVRQSTLLRVLAERRRNDLPESPGRPEAEGLPAQPDIAGIPAGRRILIAEDNDINALLARKLCERAGQQVTVAGDGRAAVREYRAAIGRGEPFDLVLMDLHMPVMDGLDAIRAIRREEERQPASRRSHVPIATLSADGRAEILGESRLAGADTTLLKPVDPASLFDFLRRQSGRRIVR
jgi:PAS domain S-box-containing protein